MRWILSLSCPHFQVTDRWHYSDVTWASWWLKWWHRWLRTWVWCSYGLFNCLFKLATKKLQHSITSKSTSHTYGFPSQRGRIQRCDWWIYLIKFKYYSGNWWPYLSSPHEPLTPVSTTWWQGMVSSNEVIKALRCHNNRYLHIRSRLNRLYMFAVQLNLV